MRRLRFDDRILFEPESMDRNDVREVQTVAEHYVRVTRDPLRRQTQYVCAIGHLRHRQVVRRRSTGPHPYESPSFADLVGRDARAAHHTAAAGARAISAPAPPVKRTLESLFDDGRLRQVGAEMRACTLGCTKRTRQLAIDNDVSLSDP